MLSLNDQSRKRLISLSDIVEFEVTVTHRRLLTISSQFYFSDGPML